jgi:hypothetical protein
MHKGRGSVVHRGRRGRPQVRAQCSPQKACFLSGAPGTAGERANGVAGCGAGLFAEVSVAWGERAGSVAVGGGVCGPLS